MRNLALLLGAVVLVTILTGSYYILHNSDVPRRQFVSATRMALYDMEITSSSFQMNGSIPTEYTCEGDGRNPPLSFIGVPEEARSLALVMYDPDVPRNLRPDGNWDHWLIWNMPTDTKGIYSGETPPGVLGSGTGGRVGYQGPCPPDKEHRYYFVLYALDAMLDLKEGASRQALESAMAGHVVTQAELVGRYNREANK